MKKLKIAFLFFTCFGLMMSCSKDETFLGEPGGMSLKKSTKSSVFIVEPSGVDDTPAIVQAFSDARDAGPGSVVQLVEGEYFIGFMEIRDFYGTLKGAGKGKTIITAMNNLDVQALWNQNLPGDLVKFVGGDVHLSHFTIQTPPGKVAVTGTATGHIRSLVNFSATNAVYEAGNESRSINVVIDNVSFKGQFLEGGPGYNHGYNCYFGVRTGYDYVDGSDIPREKIDFKITNSEINTFVYGLVLEAMKNSKLIVGEKNQGNVFSNLDQAGGVWESRNMEILIEGNTFNIPEFSWGLDLDDYPYYSNLRIEPQTKATIFNIQNNVFNLVHSEYALFLRNVLYYIFPDEPAIVYQVKNNQFNMTDGYEWSIISHYTRGMVIRNNKFSGHGDMAIVLANYSENGLILGNNFSTVELNTAAMYLTPSTSKWNIVGGNIKDRVIDLGIDNIITGVNVSTSDTPLGRSIAEKLPPMNHLMH